MKKPEQKMQCSIANYLRLKYPGLLWTISPAGLIINKSLGIMAVRMGYRSGTSDLLIFEPRGIFHGLFVELKVPGNLTSDDQDEFLTAANLRRYATAVCFTYTDTITTIAKYLEIRDEEAPF